MKHFYFAVGLILGLGIAVFAMQNTLGVEVRFLVWQVQAPLAAVVLASAAAGALVVLLFSLPAILRGRWRIRSLERRLETGPQSAGTDVTLPGKEKDGSVR